jgi:DNA-binding SARP family transcriptional activator
MSHSAPTVSLFLLGPPRIERAGAAPALKYNRARALLAYLALEPGFHTRDSLADLLWPQEPTAQGRDKLKRMLFELREALGERCVEGDRHVVRLAPSSMVWVDALAFEADTDPVLPAPPPAVGVEAESVARGWRDALDRCARAVELYRGPLLQGLRIDDAPDFDAWLDGQREAYVRRLVLALSRLARGRAQDGRLGDAMGHARRLVDIAPHHEAGWQLLIDLLMQAGRREEALHELDRCRRALARELDAEPQPATLALFNQLNEPASPASMSGGVDTARAERAQGVPAASTVANQVRGSTAASHPSRPTHSSRPSPLSAAGGATSVTTGPAANPSASSSASPATRATAGGPKPVRKSRAHAEICVPRAYARFAIGVAHLLQGRLCHATRAFEGALLAQPDEIVDLSFGTDVRSMAWSLLSITHWRAGHPDAAIEAADLAVERARRVGDPHTLAQALLGAGVLCQLRAASEQALDYTAEILDIAEHNAMPAWKLAATALSGWAMAALGDIEAIDDAHAAARALAVQMGTVETLLLSLLARTGTGTGTAS